MEDGYHGAVLVPVEAFGVEWTGVGASGLLEALKNQFFKFNS